MVCPITYGDHNKRHAKNAYFVQLQKKFSAGRPLLPAYNFSATIASTSSTYRLGAVVCLKFLAIENVPPISVNLRIVYKYEI